MKSIQKRLLAAIVLAAFGWGLAGCVGPGGYRHGWYNDGPWMGGPRGYVGVDVHPMRR